MKSSVNWRRLFYALALALLLALGALATARLLFELLYPRAAWLGQPAVALVLAAGIWLALALPLWQFARRSEGTPLLWGALPQLLNSGWLLTPAAQPDRALFMWCAALLLGGLLGRRATRQPSGFSAQLLPLAGVALVYLASMARTVGTADTFEFQVTAPQLGIAHPSGYPLYLLLGKLWTLLPVGSVAWRLNLGTLVYALIALWLLFVFVRDVTDAPLAGALTVVALGLSPTFWSQATAAEVYTLHLLFVGGALAAMWRLMHAPDAAARARWAIWLALALGLGLTNHLTTVLLAPAALAALLWATGGRPWRLAPRTLAAMALALLGPLLLYLYLPLRWQAVTGEAMGAQRFVQWVTGARFAGALQWGAWLDDPTRYAILGRLFVDNWGAPGLIVATIGLLALLWRRPRAGALLLLIWLPFCFYGLNYYVPDIDVFLLPAQLSIAAALAGVGVLWADYGRHDDRRWANGSLLALLLLAMLLVRAADQWPQRDRSAPNPLLPWAAAVLAQPLATGGVILADSDKFPPLYYLQQAERVRPDLDIMLLPDEAAYRAELAQRLAGGQTVYLARYLPRLPYALASAGPLVAVLAAPLPATAAPPLAQWDSVQLTAAEVVFDAGYAPATTAATLTWQTAAPADGSPQVYWRWQLAGVAQPATAGRHPVGNMYPTAAWPAGAAVTDFHLIAQPAVAGPTTAELQVALGPAFAAATALRWQTVAMTTLLPQTAASATVPLRIWNQANALVGYAPPAAVRPGAPVGLAFSSTRAVGAFTLTVAGAGQTLPLMPRGTPPDPPGGAGVIGWAADVLLPNADDYTLTVGSTAPLHCGWLRMPRAACAFGTLTAAGTPLPAGATNFGDLIALTDVQVGSSTLVAGGLLDVTLSWLALAAPGDDYTVFVQVVDAEERIVGQVDAWPVQGTFPTSQWQAGARVRDPYRVPLDAVLAPGDYRLYVGLYRLRDLARLPVLDADGAAIDDKFNLPTLVVP